MDERRDVCNLLTAEGTVTFPLLDVGEYFEKIFENGSKLHILVLFKNRGPSMRASVSTLFLCNLRKQWRALGLTFFMKAFRHQGSAQVKLMANIEK